MILFNSIIETFDKYKNIFELSLLFNYYSNSYFYTSKCKTYSWKEQINYKFFIFKNFYFNSNITISNKKIILEIFYESQKRLMALYKLKNLFIYKFKKYKGEQIDLNFNELNEYDKYNIILIQNNNKTLFNIFDLIKIICNSLSFDYNFFVEPKVIKNPWNNSSFSLSNLYNIYFFIKYSFIEMPLLLLRFFQSSFCLKKFKDENQFIIKQYIINNYKNFDMHKKYNYIKQMLEFYNSVAYKNNKIFIDNLFPQEKLILIFEKYIKIFLLSKFSYESDIRIKNKNILKIKLKDFKKKYPLFGIRIISLHIKKIYSISELKYKYGYLFFTTSYIPPKEMIFLNHKSFFIDYNYNHDNNYSFFPSFESNPNNIVNPVNIYKLTSFIKSVIFTEEQTKIIQSEFTPIFKNIVYVTDNFSPLESDIMNISSFFELTSIVDHNNTNQNNTNHNNTNQNITSFEFNNVYFNNIVSHNYEDNEQDNVIATYYNLHTHDSEHESNFDSDSASNFDSDSENITIISTSTTSSNN